jgi:DNA-binding CsgD family transcriptional regulator
MGADEALLGPARAANEAILSDRLAPMARRHYAWRGLGMIAAEQADSGLAARVYQPLLEAGYPSPVTNRRVLGLVAKTMGRDDLARTHFEDNLHFCRKAGFKPELAWTCHDYAGMLLSKGGPLDAPEAAKVKVLLDEGEPLAMQFGMKPLAAKLTALREKIAARRGGRPDYPDGLTEREVEVLRLIATGKSNREIGEALVISENTVIRHVSNIFSKTGVANRAEASAYAVRNGLADNTNSQV